MRDTAKFIVTREKETEQLGEFVIGPLPRGYGYTLANPIRRILLSSIEGGSVTAIKIDGADHEYSVLEGVQDDVLMIILRLKNLAVRCYSDDPVKVKIEAEAPKKGSKKITGNDIQTDPSIEIVNKDQLITTISDGVTFSAEITIEKGMGFQLGDTENRQEIGVIPVDGVFSPVENVEVKVSNTRVGQQTDLDQINLKIITNGVVTPTEALRQALEIFNQMSERLLELSQGEMEQIKEKVEKVEEVEEEEVGIPVKNLKLSTRLRNALLNSAINDLRILDGKTVDELLDIKGMGKKSADELHKVMKEHDLVVIK